MLIASFLVFAITPTDANTFYLLLVDIAIAAISIFALRGIYFALLDTYPGVEGYRYFYLIAAGFCTLGFVAALVIDRRYRLNRDS